MNENQASLFSSLLLLAGLAIIGLHLYNTFFTSPLEEARKSFTKEEADAYIQSSVRAHGLSGNRNRPGAAGKNFEKANEEFTKQKEKLAAVQENAAPTNYLLYLGIGFVGVGVGVGKMGKT